MSEEKRCSICGKPFTPDIHRPDQSVCSLLACQHKRQLNNMKQWRAEKTTSSNSSKGNSWKEACHRRSLEWRKKHQTYLKIYRQGHKEEHKEYMKEYMKQYRRRRKLATGEASIDTGGKKADTR